MFIGPVFTREVVTAPRRARLYISRSAYVSALFVLMCTAWLLVAGTQIVRNVSDMARFGAMLFQILAPLQLALAVFFSALLAASGVAQEKDRRTLVLLLLTNLTNSELVLGKLPGQHAQCARAVDRIRATVHALGHVRRSCVRADRAGVCRYLGRLRLAGSLGSTLALARENVSDAGLDRAGAGVLARCRRGAGRRRAGLPSGAASRAKFGPQGSVPGKPCSSPRDHWSKGTILCLMSETRSICFCFSHDRRDDAQCRVDSARAGLESLARSPPSTANAEEPESIWGLTEESADAMRRLWRGRCIRRRHGPRGME